MFTSKQEIAASNARVIPQGGGVARLLEIMARLRDPQSGCPWDIEQDFASIAPYTIEEAYEVADAIERGAWGELQGELGDLMLQVVYHAQMAEEAGHFAFAQVVEAISDKMIARHPHVFGEETREKSARGQRGTTGQCIGRGRPEPARHDPRDKATKPCGAGRV